MNFRVFSLIILFGVVGLSVFGFLGVSCERGGSWHCCIAEIMYQTACPHGDQSAYIDFHFGALKSFSAAVFGDAVPAFTFIFFVFLAALTPVFARNNEIPKKITINLFGLFNDFQESIFLFKQKYIRWLALHENSPAFLKTPV